MTEKPKVTVTHKELKPLINIIGEEIKNYILEGGKIYTTHNGKTGYFKDGIFIEEDVANPFEKNG